MKKILPLMVFALAATMFTSCKKEYKCTCTTSSGGTVVGTSSQSLGKQTKKDAESACSALSSSSSAGGVTVSASCKLD